MSIKWKRAGEYRIFGYDENITCLIDKDMQTYAITKNKLFTINGNLPTTVTNYEGFVEGIVKSINIRYLCPMWEEYLRNTFGPMYKTVASRLKLLRLRDNKRVAIIGPTRSGKTTLRRILTEVLPDDYSVEEYEVKPLCRTGIVIELTNVIEYNDMYLLNNLLSEVNGIKQWLGVGNE